MSAARSNPDIDPTDDLAMLCGYAEEAFESLYEPNQLALRDQQYYHNHQWSAAEREKLRKRGQPDTFDNHIADKIDLLCGLERKARVDPNALPRTPQDEDNADAATHALRYVKDDNKYDIVRSAIYQDMLLPGVGGIEVTAEPNKKTGEQRVINRRIPWDRLIYDPHSRFKDFSDAKYLGSVVWMDYNDALDLYPDAADILDSTIGNANDGRIYDDRPSWMVWADAKRRRVKFVQLNYRQSGEWMFATFTKGGFLDAPMISPYLDHEGDSAPQFFAASIYVDTDNSRYGYARRFISQQDSINHRQSKASHLLNVNQVIATKGMVSDIDKARRELAKPDGYVETNPIPDGKFEVRDTSEMSEGQFKLLEYSVGRMQAMGPNASMSGDDPRDLSGKAIIAQQTGGAIEIEPIADELRQLDIRVFEANWMRIRQFWTAEKWLRVTKDGQETQWVGLNRKVTLAEELAEMPPDQQAQAMQQLQLQPNDPRLQMVIGTMNDIQNVDVDITIDDSPEFPTLQAQGFEQLTQLVQAGVQIPPKALILASALHNKNDIIKMMDEAAQAQAQVQQQAQQIGQAQAVANVQKTQAQTQDLKARAANSGASAMDTQIETIWKMRKAREAQAHAFAAVQAAGVLNQAANASGALIAQGAGA